jgi:hypothetical protein
MSSCVNKSLTNAATENPIQHYRLIVNMTKVMSNTKLIFFIITTTNLQQHIIPRTMTDLNKIGPIDLNWALRWSYLLLVVQVRTTTHCMFYRERHWAPYLLRLAMSQIIEWWLAYIRLLTINEWGYNNFDWLKIKYIT